MSTLKGSLFKIDWTNAFLNFWPCCTILFTRVSVSRISSYLYSDIIEIVLIQKTVVKSDFVSMNYYHRRYLKE